MKIFLHALSAWLSFVVGLSAGEASEEPSPAVKEVVDVFRRETDGIELSADNELSRLRLQTIERLQPIQDRLCRDAKLDEAVAVRDHIRWVSGKSPVGGSRSETRESLPLDAREIAKAHDLAVVELERKTLERIQAAGARAAVPLDRLMKELCREAKLDEALAVRNVIANLTGVIRDVRPDPGQLRAGSTEIVQVWYFEVTGNLSGSIYGTDIYTSDSTLATAAVHTGVLKEGEKGIVKVTILPGHENYASTSRRGITSHGYSAWGVSFKVERGYGIVKPTLGGN
ncbi:MAG: hypothetical protein K8U03_04105 [Planctomycetia bacterium]|nr:hypothetical protein [Planctomycetia bacterium]